MYKNYVLLLTACGALYGAASEVAPFSMVYGAATLAGMRHRGLNEDRYYIKDSEDELYCGVFDGHAGHRASDAAVYGKDKVKPIHGYIDALKKSGEKLGPDLFTIAFKSFDTAFRWSRMSDGTTAVTTIIDKKNNQLYIASTGDSGALLINTKGEPVYRTPVHNPNCPEEKERLSKVNAPISYGGSVPRIAGLAMSRSLGDAPKKDKSKRDSGGHDVIIPDPAVKSIALESDHRALLLATDGFWDVMPEGEAATTVLTLLSSESKFDMTVIANKLCRIARNKKTRDDISVIVVDLANLSK